MKKELKDYILDVSNEDLLTINMNDIKDHSDIINFPGIEYYRLLAGISLNFDDMTFYDVGSYRGHSAICLAANPKNKVISYDVEDHEPDQRDNITYVKSSRITKVNEADLILYDTVHDGETETKFLDSLIRRKYSGLLILDDIHLNDEMKEFWNSVDLEKYDITNKGHYTGTGLVIC